ncbi:hypothetical protein [Mesorhizobium sp. 8]|uniref:hypothetical protein n=1 Tax=Mesorhizobium sp. 8 TaxID=2584466 RepID=UPI00112063F2|nr:hypothetical protein [Mesorhizobium sp. 8]QDC01729.1 hypothetical protein FGU64_15580 [Mesorhizobium sp. 8]
MKSAVIIAALTALLAGCEQSKTVAETPECFSIVSGNGTQPNSPLMVNGCTGETWLLVKSNKSDKPADGFTYQWFKLDRIDFMPPTLVNR